jgi:hypothetical protein
MHYEAVNHALFAAQSVSDLAALKVAVGHGLIVGAAFSLVYLTFKLCSRFISNCRSQKGGSQ